jgi:hypothetical protein
MDGFITELEHSRSVIGERTEAIRRVFAAEGVSATSLDPIGEIEHWIDERLPDLRRRSKIAHDTAKLPDWSPGTTGGLVAYEEQHVLPAAEARRLGTDLAAKYQEMASTSWYPLSRNDGFREIVTALAAHVDDPEYTAAFFAALGTQGTRELPMVLRQNLAPPGEGLVAPPRPDDELLRTVSLAFATAVSAGSYVPGFSKVKDGLGKPSSDSDQASTGLLLSAGRFPTEWLAQIAVANGLGTPRKVSSGLLYALGNNPAAARLALNTVTGNDQVKLKKYLEDLTVHTATPGMLAGEPDAFGRMLAAASGAYDEKDGKHSKDAAFFAFTVMTTMGKLNAGQAARIHLAEIAGSYATEITEGANLGDANHLLPSAFGDVKSRIPRLNSKFRLSPEDTYRFIKTFSDSLDNKVPFQAGMDILATGLIGQGVQDMVKSKNPTRMDDVFAALGNVSGFQLAAQEKLGKDKDDAAETSSKVTSWLIGTGMNIAGLVPPIESISLTWTVLSTAESTVDTFKQDDQTEVEKIRTTDGLETLGRQLAIAQSLMDAGFTPKVSPRDYQAAHSSSISIANANGKLRPFADILKKREPGLEELDRWFIENGLGGDKNSLGDVSRFLADRFEGRKNYAAERAQQYDP